MFLNILITSIKSTQDSTDYMKKQLRGCNISRHK